MNDSQPVLDSIRLLVRLLRLQGRAAQAAVGLEDGATTTGLPVAPSLGPAIAAAASARAFAA
ncbi:MAG: hypothetical protein ABI837_08370 [Acidobacteriota bacterium]